MSSEWSFMEKKVLDCIQSGGFELRVGQRVRIRPRARADVMDLIFDGKAATIETIEQDFDDRIYLAVTFEDDPGADLGQARMIGHRFFFAPEEVEPIAGEEVT